MSPRAARAGPAESASRLIDAMIDEAPGWQGKTLASLRKCIRQADPAIVEEVKWRKPSNPDGVPVWSHDGIVCVGNLLKAAVRLTFPKGAEIEDPTHVFNTRLDSRSVRAVDVHETEAVDRAALTAIVRRAVRLNVADRAEPS
jgi:hypothetical protein